MIADTTGRFTSGEVVAGTTSAAPLSPPAAVAAQLDTRTRTWALIVLSGALFSLLAQAFVPIEEFIHRGDDAYYYFKVAANYPRLGYWSFDGAHPTNGVQPLWAVVLTGVAQALSWAGVTEPHLLARAFVGLTALLHFASSLLLFNLLARKVSTGTGIAVGGAFLFPLGIVWARVWGMENSLYALTLVGTISYFHLTFLRRPATRPAIILGLLFGLTALSRLTAGIFVACLLGYYLLRGSGEGFMTRLRLAVIAGGRRADPPLLRRQLRHHRPSAADQRGRQGGRRGAVPARPWHQQPVLRRVRRVPGWQHALPHSLVHHLPCRRRLVGSGRTARFRRRDSAPRTLRDLGGVGDAAAVARSAKVVGTSPRALYRAGSIRVCCHVRHRQRDRLGHNAPQPAQVRDDPLVACRERDRDRGRGRDLVVAALGYAAGHVWRRVRGRTSSRPC